MGKEHIRRLEIRRLNENIPIFISRGYTDKNCPIHAHNYYELELVMDGNATHVINGTKYEIKRGCSYILSPLDFHYYQLHSPLDAYCLNFDTSVLSPKIAEKVLSLEKKNPILLDESSLRNVSSIADILIRECRREDGGCSIELCNGLLALVLREASISQEKQNTIVKDVGLQRAIFYLNTHFFESPSLEVLANVAGYNSSYFSDIFKKNIGESYTAHLNSLKVEYAKVLLSHGSKVIDACFDSGFRSLSSFLTVFKKHTGIPPKEYKILHSK
jgi:AraC-like DNA-binding protein